MSSWTPIREVELVEHHESMQIIMSLLRRLGGVADINLSEFESSPDLMLVITRQVNLSGTPVIKLSLKHPAPNTLPSGMVS